jgi:hypothetical protein
VLSGLKKNAEAKNHTATLKELSASLDAEVKGQVVDVEGHTLKLTGSAEQQYVEWRKTLHEIYGEEAGVAASPDALPRAAPLSAPAEDAAAQGAEPAAPASVKPGAPAIDPAAVPHLAPATAGGASR